MCGYNAFSCSTEKKVEIIQIPSIFRVLAKWVWRVVSRISVKYASLPCPLSLSSTNKCAEYFHTYKHSRAIYAIIAPNRQRARGVRILSQHPYKYTQMKWKKGKSVWVKKRKINGSHDFSSNLQMQYFDILSGYYMRFALTFAINSLCHLIAICDNRIICNFLFMSIGRVARELFERPLPFQCAGE